MSNMIIEAKNLQKTYKDGKLQVEVLTNIELQLQKGEQIAIIGASGSGKSTLLHLLGGLDKPSAGQVLIEGADIHHLSEKQRCQLRNQKLGFVYQLHHLLPEFTVLENVCMPLLLRKISVQDAQERAHFILEKVGLAKRVAHKLSEISGGERQRTAIARALVANPVCVLADEPTGNLDRHTAESVYETMLQLNRELGTSFIIVTHDLQLAGRMDKVYELVNGNLQLAQL
jgi:lipoprotein-releasing system ATP-binding protein